MKSKYGSTIVIDEKTEKKFRLSLIDAAISSLKRQMENETPEEKYRTEIAIGNLEEQRLVVEKMIDDEEKKELEENTKEHIIIGLKPAILSIAIPKK